MEIFIPNTFETVLTDLHNLKESEFNISSFVPVWYSSTMDAIEPDMNQLISTINTNIPSELPKANALRKDMFITDGIFDDNKFDLWFDEIMNLYKSHGYQYFDKYGDFKEEQSKEHLKNNVKCGGGVATSLCFKDQEENEIVIPFCTINNYRNPLDTTHTTFHELCHCLQKAYNINRNIQLIEELKEYKKLKEKYGDNPTAEEENELNRKFNIYFKNERINFYIMETQANLFASTYIMLKTLLTNPEKAEEIKTELINLANYNFFGGYNDFVLTKKLMEEMCAEPKNFLKDFTSEGKIDFKKCFDFTLEIVKNKSIEYEEFLNSEIDKNTDLSTLNLKLRNTTDNNPISSDYAAGQKHMQENKVGKDTLSVLEELIYRNLPTYISNKRYLDYAVKEINNCGNKINEQLTEQNQQLKKQHSNSNKESLQQTLTELEETKLFLNKATTSPSEISV